MRKSETLQIRVNAEQQNYDKRSLLWYMTNCKSRKRTLYKRRLIQAQTKVARELDFAKFFRRIRF